MFKKVIKHETIELSLFCQEKFSFPKNIWFQGLDTFTQMKGDCYPDVVEVFYNNVKVVDGNIHSRVKGVDIVINNDTQSHQLNCRQNQITRKTNMFKDYMRYHGRYRKEKTFLFKWLYKEEKVVTFIIGHILLPGRPNLIKLTPRDVCLLNGIIQRIPTNWVAVLKWHILDVWNNNWHRLPYGVFISKVLEQNGVNLSREEKFTQSKANLIGKATLTCIGLKKTTFGWCFIDEAGPTKEKETLLDYDSNQEFPPPNSEFEKRVGDRLKRVTKRINSIKKTLFTLNEKMDEILKHYVDVSSSSEESVRVDADEISEESSIESSES